LELGVKHQQIMKQIWENKDNDAWNEL